MSLTGFRVDTLVVDPGSFHVDRTGGGQDVAFCVVAVADHQAVAVLVAVVSELVDVGGDLRLQCGGEHLACSVADDLVEQRPPGRCVAVVGLVVFVYYREHGRTFPTSVGALVLIEYLVSCRSSSGKVRPSPSTGIDHYSQLGLARETVRRFYYASSVDELLGAPRAGKPTMLDEFATHLHSRFNDGYTSAAALYEELQALGYRGSYSSVRDYLRPLRSIGAAPARKQIPKIRRITSWMLRHPDNLTDDEQIGHKQVLASCPHLEATAAHVKSFAEMLTEHLGKQLNSWMAAVSTDDLPHLDRFVRGLDTDHAAVRNGLTLPYSSGAVEGHVNRIKMLKRQMYGRAGFDLLRKRILLSN